MLASSIAILMSVTLTGSPLQGPLVTGKPGQVPVMKTSSQAVGSSNLKVNADGSITNYQDGGGAVSTTFGFGESGIIAADATGLWNCTVASGESGLSGGIVCTDNLGNIGKIGFTGTEFNSNMPLTAPSVDAGSALFGTAVVTGAFTYNGGKTPAATTDLRSYAIFTGTPTTAVLGSALVQGVFSAPSAGVPARFAFRVNTAGLGAGSVTLSLFDSTTSASKGSATFGCTATGDQSLAVTSPTAWAVNDAVEIRIDDSACTAANGPIGIPSASVQWQ